MAQTAHELYDITNTIYSKGGGHMTTTVQSDDSGCDLMDDSLTDMQWLQRMDAGADFPGLGQARLKKRGLSHKENKGKDGCRKKLEYNSKKDSNKPPLSYASLIALAICSTPQRMMTLSSIYHWIETTFPFYRTPEAKAWKNSIRHNLSIRKNMFMKVYQYPPRRGNGSYWTLLSDGEDELKRAIPLFSTLLPPIIDQSCVYNRTPSTHVVKSRGQFVPVLPSAVNPSGQPYFAVGTVPTSKAGMTISKRKHGSLNKYMVPRHLLDHSYAKQPPQEEEEEEENQAVDSDSSDHESTFDAPATPKRKRLSGISVHRPLHEKRSPHAASGAKQDGKVLSLSPSTKQQDNSLNLLDSSLLTPVKNLMPDIEIDSLSLSPLYNFVTPRRGNTPMNFPSPFTPFKQATFTGVDSGIFSPLRTENLKFSTPVRNLSPLTDLLPPNTFSTPQDIFTSFKILDTSSGFGGTPFRPGSLQFLGLPGLTPPSASNRSQI